MAAASLIDALWFNVSFDIATQKISGLATTVSCEER
jgi:hypothetical protein